ncbi:chromosome segregation protein SMC, partial [Candidatus Woesearchaeota archaeon]|nr:chromosome segregation protein SMC [Candidatus Woesearchaeota archaeon]
GFKSFAKKVEIPLGEKFNVILGPNGSGKSNVVDAITFVLGKTSAKSMRAEKSANLIYNGGKNSSPASEAEVSIFFENVQKEFPIDSKEVKISRVVKKNGNSIYKINNDTVTRQQVIDLLYAAKIDPDGHNIILQGDIIHFMEMRSEERREIIEEIAGISVYEEKKQKAMQELSKVQEKLNEADIILTERDKTLKELKKDRDEALKFKDIETDLARSKATKLHLQIKEKEEKKAAEDSGLNKLKGEVDAIQKKIEEEKQGIKQKKENIHAINKDLHEKGDVKQRQMANEIGDLKTSNVKLALRKDVVVNEIKKLAEREKQLKLGVNEIKEKVAQLQKEKKLLQETSSKSQRAEKEAEAQLESLKKKYGLVDLADLNQKAKSLEMQIEQEQKNLGDLESKYQETLRKIDKARFELDAVVSEIGKEEESRKEDKEKLVRLKELKAEFKGVTKNLSDCLNESSVLSAQLGNARNKYMDATDEFAKLRARSISIREVASGDIAIQKIKGMNIEGVYGTVSELGHVNSKYALAMEVAAGQRIKSLVVSSDLVASKCIDILKQNKTGVVTFLPLNKLREREIEEEAKRVAKSEGSHGLAIDLVAYESKFKSVFKFVFGSTLIVDNLATARKIGVGRARMVTLDGDLLETSGAMVGGYRRNTGMGFKEKEVTLGLEKVEGEVKRLSDTISLLEKKKMENDESIGKLRERKAVLEAEILPLEKQAEGIKDGTDMQEKKRRLSQDLASFEKEIKEWERSKSTLQKTLESLRKERSSCIESITKATASTNSSELADLDAKRQALREDLIRLESQIKSLESQTDLHSKESEKMLTILAEAAKEKQAFQNELQELETRAEEAKKQLKEKEDMQKQFYSDYQHLFSQKTALEKQILAHETSIIKFEEKARSFEHRANEISVKAALLSGELEGLNKEFEQYKEVQLRRGVSVEELNADIRNFEQALRGMGSINMRALEIYEKVQEEYNALLEKYEKLKIEKQDVLDMMFEIEKNKKEIFMRSFEMVNKNFQQIYSSLSTKGDSHLIVENEEDPFAAGVDIQVRLMGKRPLDIKSLSGGEKTMAALAFIFAIQEFEPAHFYLMDEVDAALDKRNSELLSKLIA